MYDHSCHTQILIFGLNCYCQQSTHVYTKGLFLPLCKYHVKFHWLTFCIWHWELRFSMSVSAFRVRFHFLLFHNYASLRQHYSVAEKWSLVLCYAKDYASCRQVQPLCWMGGAIEMSSRQLGSYAALGVASIEVSTARQALFRPSQRLCLLQQLLKT